MARQLKTFLRNRKAEMLGCGPCECRTLQCWRYANENCNCGENMTILMTDEEIIALGDHEVVLEELNKYPTAYYEKFLNEGHIWASAPGFEARSEDGTRGGVIKIEETWSFYYEEDEALRSSSNR